MCVCVRARAIVYRHPRRLQNRCIVVAGDEINALIAIFVSRLSWNFWPCELATLRVATFGVKWSFLCVRFAVRHVNVSLNQHNLSIQQPSVSLNVEKEYDFFCFPICLQLRTAEQLDHSTTALKKSLRRHTCQLSPFGLWIHLCANLFKYCYRT